MPAPKIVPEAARMGLELRRLRDESGLTQKEVAERIGMEDKAYAHYETGRAILKVPLLRPLAGALRVTPAVLLERLGIVDADLDEAAEAREAAQIIGELAQRLLRRRPRTNEQRRALADVAKQQIDLAISLDWRRATRIPALA